MRCYAPYALATLPIIINYVARVARQRRIVDKRDNLSLETLRLAYVCKSLLAKAFAEELTRHQTAALAGPSPGPGATAGAQVSPRRPSGKAHRGRCRSKRGSTDCACR